MEGKGVRVPISTVTMVVLILGLVLAQTHVEAFVYCPTTDARTCYNACRLKPRSSESTCAFRCGCSILPGNISPTNYPKHFCMLGCASSMCSTLSTLQNSDVGEDAVEGCNNKCSDLCNQDSNAVFTA